MAMRSSINIFIFVVVAVIYISRVGHINANGKLSAGTAGSHVLNLIFINWWKRSCDQWVKAKELVEINE